MGLLARSRRDSPGDWPNARLNALPSDASLSYPVFWAIAYTVRLVVVQITRRATQSHPRQVAHWRLADRASKALAEVRARHAQFNGHVRNRPASLRLAVQEIDRSTDR